MQADGPGGVLGLGAQMGGDDEVLALEEGGVEARTLGETTGGKLVSHYVGGEAAQFPGL